MASFGFHTTSDHAAAALKASIQGLTVIITGVSPGSLGAETARVLVAHGPAQMILASSNARKIADVVETLEAKTDTVIHALELDLSSTQSVRKASAQVSKWVTSVDVLILTAGIMATPTFQESPEHIELQFAVNHLGHFLFTNLVVDKLLDSKRGATVVTYTSEAHQKAQLNIEDWTYNDGKDYDKWLAYSNSKAANILFSVGLVQKYGPRGLRAFSVDPGIIVTTSLTRNVAQSEFKALGWLDELDNMNPAIKTKTLAEGSASGIVAAFDKSFTNHDGTFVTDCALSDDAAAPFARDKAMADRLWAVSERLVGQEFNLSQHH